MQGLVKCATKLAAAVGDTRVVGSLLRRLGRCYAEGSVVTIRCGGAAGMRWKRHHRYVNGYWAGTYELPLQRLLAGELRPGMTFFDVGANAGFFTLIGARAVGPTGRCVAFDPLPENARSIRAQINLNGLTGCEVVEAAVAEESGWADFCSEGAGSPTAHLGPRAGHEDTRRVRTTTLSDACREWGRPDLIKLDIEGAEALAVEGARELLQFHHPVWIIELHGPAPAEKVKALLSRWNYCVHEVEGGRPAASGVFPRHVMAK